MKEEIDSFRYSVPLTDRQGYIVYILAYGIDRITADIENINTQSVVGLFMLAGSRLSAQGARWTSSSDLNMQGTTQ